MHLVSQLLFGIFGNEQASVATPNYHWTILWPNDQCFLLQGLEWLDAFKT